MDNRRFRKSDNASVRMFIAYIAFLLLLSAGIMLMPVGSELKTKSLLFTIVSGITTWLGLFGAIFTAIKINILRKRCNTFKVEKPQFGLIHFFQNKEAFIIDLLMFISILGFVFSRIFISKTMVLFVFLSLFVFFFGMHCMLNGVNYRYIKFKTGRDQES